jgi:hypothetical protein
MADYTVTPGDVQNSAGARTVTGDASEAITAGQLVYKLANGKYGKCDADGATPLYKAVGIALDGAGADQPIAICLEDPDFVPGFTEDAGVVVIGSATAGGLAPATDVATGMFVSVVGIMKEDNHMVLKILRSDVAAA